MYHIILYIHTALPSCKSSWISPAHREVTPFEMHTCIIPSVHTSTHKKKCLHIWEISYLRPITGFALIVPLHNSLSFSRSSSSSHAERLIYLLIRTPRYESPRADQFQYINVACILYIYIPKSAYMTFGKIAEIPERHASAPRSLSRSP